MNKPKNSLEVKCKNLIGEEGAQYCNAKISMDCPYKGTSFMKYTNNKLTKLKTYYFCEKIK